MKKSKHIIAHGTWTFNLAGLTSRISREHFYTKLSKALRVKFLITLEEYDVCQTFNAKLRELKN